MTSIELNLRTLTPIWTGGIETGKMDRVHEAGLIGSLRWWYEAIIRGLGGMACDPTQHSCTYDPQKLNNGLCEVCQLFGATGWKRRFILQVEANTRPVCSPSDLLTAHPSQRPRNWHLHLLGGHIGTLTLYLHGEQEALSKIMALLQFLESWGHLGSRPQLGYGRFQIKNRPSHPTWLWSVRGDKTAKDSDALSDLRTFTFFKFTFEPGKSDWWREITTTRFLKPDFTRQLATQHQMFPTTNALRNYFRFRLNWRPELAQWFFGTLQHKQRIRSKIIISWAYQQDRYWQMVGWFYLPQDKIGRYQTPTVLRTLEPAFEQPQSWLRGLGLESGYRYPTHIQLLPISDLWNSRTSQQIAQFLNYSQRDSNDD